MKMTTCLSLTAVFIKIIYFFLFSFYLLEPPNIFWCVVIKSMTSTGFAAVALHSFPTALFFKALFKNAVQLNYSLNTYICNYCH